MREEEYMQKRKYPHPPAGTGGPPAQPPEFEATIPEKNLTPPDPPGIETEQGEKGPRETRMGENSPVMTESGRWIISPETRAMRLYDYLSRAPKEKWQQIILDEIEEAIAQTRKEDADVERTYLIE